MRKPSDTALKRRARELIEQMSRQARFVYALPIEAAREAGEGILTGHGLVLTGERIWANPERTVRITLTVHDALAVALVCAEGVDAAAPLAALLERTGFYAQSALLASACEGGTDDARKALATLSHMVIAWDDSWRQLFDSFARSKDPLDREAAAEAFAVASAKAGEP
jgi:hypothetical protein